MLKSDRLLVIMLVVNVGVPLVLLVGMVALIVQHMIFV
jgi:hypothetical protein